MIFAIGEGARVAAVSNYDHFPPTSPGCRVSAGCSIRASSASSPSSRTWSIVYATQSELIERLDRAGIAYFNYQHKALPDILTTIRAIGARIGSRGARPKRWRRRWNDRSQRSAARPPPCRVRGRCSSSSASRRRCAMSYASGGYGFLHDMLEVAGGAMCSRDIKQQSVQASTEMMLARTPDVIIELLYGDRLKNADSPTELRAWDALAVGAGGARASHAALTGDEFVVPGPRVVEATKLARALHPGGLPMKTLVSWSSGKDSAWMVHTLRQRGDVEIGALLTTINEPAQRVAMHAVRVDCSRRKRRRSALPLWLVPIPSPCPNEMYEQAMRGASRAQSPTVSRTPPSATCFSRTSGATAKIVSPAAD